MTQANLHWIGGCNFTSLFFNLLLRNNFLSYFGENGLSPEIGGVLVMLAFFLRALNLNKQQVLTPGHQGWKDLHSLCGIGMEYYLLNDDNNNNNNNNDDDYDNNNNNDDDNHNNNDNNNNNNDNDDDDNKNNNNNDNDYNHNNDAKNDNNENDNDKNSSDSMSVTV